MAPYIADTFDIILLVSSSCVKLPHKQESNSEIEASVLYLFNRTFIKARKIRAEKDELGGS